MAPDYGEHVRLALAGSALLQQHQISDIRIDDYDLAQPFMRANADQAARSRSAASPASLHSALAHMSASADKYLRLTFLFVMGVIAAAVVLVPMALGVWLPDVVFAREITLAEHRLASGYIFRVVQYWNRVDFYSTELRVTSPDGRTEARILDGDDSKRWRLPLTVDELHRTATVALGGGRIRQVDW